MRFWIPSVPQAATHPAGTGRAKEVPFLGFWKGFSRIFVEKQLSSKHSIRKKIYTK
jgi:hypothetical protein